MSMIQSTLELIRGKLNDHLMADERRREDAVILSNIVEQNGAPFEEAKDKVVMCLANIQHEQVLGTHSVGAAVVGERAGVTAPPLYIHLYLLLYANFSGLNYRGRVGHDFTDDCLLSAKPCIYA